MQKHKDELPKSLRSEVNALNQVVSADYALSGKLTVLLDFIKKWD